MAASNDRDAFYARCLRVTSVATAAGVTMRKSEGRGKPTLSVSGNGKTVEFPIVTDDRAWRETSVEEAFYVVLLDAREWSGAHVDEASIATLVDDVERMLDGALAARFNVTLAAALGDLRRALL
ncbi:MAG: hypothetical protein NVS2B8_18190 [Vulcanimicrobiaceae bacterium]